LIKEKLLKSKNCLLIETKGKKVICYFVTCFVFAYFYGRKIINFKIFLRMAKLRIGMALRTILNRIKLQNKDTLDFFEFAKTFIGRMENDGRGGSAKNYRVAVRRLSKFLGRENLGFNEMTATFRKRYCDWMVKSRLGARGQELYLVAIRAIFNDALSTFNDYEIGKIKIRTNPFKNFDIPKPKFKSLAEKKSLSVNILQRIFTAPVVTKREKLARDIFMLSFCLCGMNAVDLYACNEVKGMQLIYFRQKTKDRRNDDAEMRINIPMEVAPIFEKYRALEGEYVFLFSQYYSENGSFTAAINIGLKSINKKLGLNINGLSLYYARYSWATIASNEVHLPDGLVDECLVHAPVCRMLRTYVKRDWSRIDRANRKVLDYVFYGKTPPEGSVSV
jgi:hypothetical protein